MADAKWTLALILMTLVAAVAGYFVGTTVEEEAPTFGCFFCGDPLGEHAVTVLPNETTPFTGPVTVCAPCYRQAVGVDKQGEGP